MNKADGNLDIEVIAFNIKQAAVALGIDHERMGSLVRVGRVPHLRLGERVLIGKQALERWLTDECLASVGKTERPTELGTVRRRNRTGTA